MGPGQVLGGVNSEGAKAVNSPLLSSFRPAALLLPVVNDQLLGSADQDVRVLTSPLFVVSSPDGWMKIKEVMSFMTSSEETGWRVQPPWLALVQLHAGRLAGSTRLILTLQVQQHQPSCRSAEAFTLTGLSLRHSERCLPCQPRRTTGCIRVAAALIQVAY